MIFTPSAPVNQLTLLRGRKVQINRVLQTIQHVGQHAIIYGERGVGKTSLASVIDQLLIDIQIQKWYIAYVEANASDDYATLWRKIFQKLNVTDDDVINTDTQRSLNAPATLSEWLGDAISPDEVLRVSRLVKGRLIVIIDELDKLKGRDDVNELIANTIKILSDHRVPVTLILVGVADSIDELIRGHASIDRQIIQIKMPRMSANEIMELVVGGLKELGLTITPDAQVHIVNLAQGLPSPAHHIALECVYQIVDGNRAEVTKADVDAALRVVIDKLPESLMYAWTTAIRAKQGALFRDVLLAAALTPPSDDLGWFVATDVRPAFEVVTGKVWSLGYSQHLHLLADERGNVLEKQGVPYGWKYRFRNPLMQTFIVMHALATHLVEEAAIEKLRGV